MIKILFFTLLIFSATSSNAQRRYMVDCEWTTEEPTEGVFAFAEVEPEFPGGEEKMTAFIDSTLVKPKDENGEIISGIVYVQFIVDKYGQIKGPYVIKSTNEILNQAAIAVIKKMPKWSPGEQAGKHMCVTYTLPIKF